MTIKRLHSRDVQLLNSIYKKYVYIVLLVRARYAIILIQVKHDTKLKIKSKIISYIHPYNFTDIHAFVQKQHHQNGNVAKFDGGVVQPSQFLIIGLV